MIFMDAGSIIHLGGGCRDLYGCKVNKTPGRGVGTFMDARSIIHLGESVGTFMDARSIIHLGGGVGTFMDAGSTIHQLSPHYKTI